VRAVQKAAEERLTGRKARGSSSVRSQLIHGRKKVVKGGSVEFAE
jgi:hypothetical protein